MPNKSISRSIAVSLLLTSVLSVFMQSATAGDDRIQSKDNSKRSTAEALSKSSGFQDVSECRKVRPGLVNWVPDFEEAKKRAASSGKHILVFQMMGKLDDEFC